MNKLSEEQIAHFYREGYLLARGFAPKKTIKSVQRAGKQHLHNDPGWLAKCFDHDNPTVDSDVHQLLYDPVIYNAASQLLGGSPARIIYGMLAVVSPGGGHGLPWHQDNMYSHYLGGALNLFIAVSAITQDMATLWVAPRSHLQGVRPSVKNATTAPGHLELAGPQPEGLCLPDLEPGDVCIFDRNCLHRSLQNTTPRHRVAYAAQYQSDFARLADTGALTPRNMRAADLRKMIRAK